MTVVRLAEALGTRYRIERELGGGGMSRVFLAREVALDRAVVIKVVAPEVREGLSAERFTREVQVAARLQQANIVPLLSAGDADGLAYYTMPYVAGHSLRERIAAGPLPLGEALDVLRDVARALAYAHAEGIVHRDVKPENVLLSAAAAVVTDFGIAKALSASRTGAPGGTLTQVGASLGTPAYMAPEQALGDEVDARADLYAWGVIAYELLAGRHPFATHTTAQRLVAAHVSERPAPLRTVRRDVPPAVAALVMRCLAKDPRERPAAAAEVLAGLASPGAARTPRRVWMVAALAALVAVVAVAGLALVYRPSHAAPAKTVVVVPFENLGEATDAYFAEGVSDEIAGQLARLPGVAVMGRDGVRRFRGSRRAPRDIARELGAAYVLSGTVRWARAARAPGHDGAVDADARVRINPALVNVATGVQEWGEPSEERLTDVFRAQADVAERVARALSVTLGSAARATLRHPESADPEARDAQLLGRYYLRRRGLENLQRAEEAFTRATLRDSGYARAWAGLSESIALQPAYDSLGASDALLDRAERAARRAVTLDGASPDAQLALARVYATRFAFRQADVAVTRALALDSSATLAHLLAFQVHGALGRMHDAGEDARRALALDGASALALNTYAVWLLDMGHADSAVAYAERAVALDSLQPLWRRTLANVYARAGRVDDAVRECRRALGTNACVPISGLLANVPAQRAPARAVLDTLGTRRGLLAQPSFAALGYAILGAPDSMFARLAVAIRRRDDSFSYLIGNAAFAPYARDPRWDAIVGAVRR